jgi:hypothetical protein
LAFLQDFRDRNAFGRLAQHQVAKRLRLKQIIAYSGFDGLWRFVALDLQALDVEHRCCRLGEIPTVQDGEAIVAFADCLM